MPTILVPNRKITAPRIAVRGAPFTRKAWDNPVKYKLNRAFGDEFEGYSSFAQLIRRWAPASGGTPPVAGDFFFPGGSEIEWRLPTGASASCLQCAAPAGDFEALLEVSFGLVDIATNNLPFAPGIALVDATGVGAAGSYYMFNNSIYTTTLTSGFGTTGTNNLVASGYTVLDGRHTWISVRRTGTTLQARFSADGSTFSAFTTGVTVSATAAFLAIGKMYPGITTTPPVVHLHRLNIYPGPTFFPG